MPIGNKFNIYNFFSAVFELKSYQNGITENDIWQNGGLIYRNSICKKFRQIITIQLTIQLNIVIKNNISEILWHCKYLEREKNMFNFIQFVI